MCRCMKGYYVHHFLNLLCFGVGDSIIPYPLFPQFIRIKWKSEFAICMFTCVDFSWVENTYPNQLYEQVFRDFKNCILLHFIFSSFNLAFTIKCIQNCCSIANMVVWWVVVETQLKAVYFTFLTLNIPFYCFLNELFYYSKKDFAFNSQSAQHTPKTKSQEMHLLTWHVKWLRDSITQTNKIQMTIQ